MPRSPRNQHHQHHHHENHDHHGTDDNDHPNPIRTCLAGQDSCGTELFPCNGNPNCFCGTCGQTICRGAGDCQSCGSDTDCGAGRICIQCAFCDGTACTVLCPSQPPTG